MHGDATRVVVPKSLTSSQKLGNNRISFRKFRTRAPLGMVFYGWVVLAAGMALDLAAAPGHSTGIAIFVDDLMSATGVTRSEISLTCSVASGMASLATPVVGHVLDGYGARPVALLAAVELRRAGGPQLHDPPGGPGGVARAAAVLRPGVHRCGGQHGNWPVVRAAPRVGGHAPVRGDHASGGLPGARGEHD